RIIGCEFRETTSDKELLKMITLTADADRCVIAYNRFLGEAGGTDSIAINFEGGSDKTIIAQNTFIGDWSGYVIDGSTAASTELAVYGNYIHNCDTSAGKTMAFHASATGGIFSNRCYGNGASFAIVGDAMFVSPDNIVMATENAEVRNYESMFGAFTGDGGTDAGDSIYADMVLAQTDLDAIIADFVDYSLDELVSSDDAAGATPYPDSVVQDSIFAFLMSKSASPVATSYDNTKHSLQAIGDDTDTLIVDTTAIQALLAAMNNTGYVGTCSNNAVTTTAIVSILAGFGDDYFNTGWFMIVIKNASGAGTAPEGEIIDITDYSSATGTFTLNVAATEALTTGDCIMLKRTEELELDMPTALGGAGTIRYVDSGTSGDGSGLTWENAYATLALAEAACSAGDVIYVADGHNENITTGGDVINVANITVIGMGKGDARPLFDFDAADDELTLDAAGITLKNLRFRPGATIVTACIRVEDAGIGCTIEDCAFVDGEASTTDEFVDAVSVDTLASNLTVKNCTYFSADATGHTNTFVNLDEATIANATIEGCTVFGMFAEAPIWGAASIPTNVTIRNNTISNTTTGQLCIEFQGAATGVCVGNRLYSDSYATMLDPGSLKCIDNLGADAIDQQAIAVPISAETSDVTAVADGSELERLELLQEMTDDALAAMGLDQAVDNTYYVDSVAANGGTGLTWETSENTLVLAIGDVTTNTGATIFLAANHAENIGGATAVNKAGMTIIGLGSGESRPILTFDTQTDSLVHTVPNVKYKNIIFVVSTQDCTAGITLDASSDGAVFEDCEFRNTTTSEFVNTVTLAAATDNVRFTRCKFINNTAAGGNVAAISSTAGVTNNLVIEDCYFYGAFTTAAILSDQVEVNLQIKNNTIYNTSTGDYAIKLSAAALGIMSGNKCYADTWGTIIDPGSLKCYDNYVTTAIDETGYLYPDRPQKIDSVHGTGRVIYVDSGVAAAGGGGTWATALQTIDAAMDLTSADRGDVIYVAQGHKEVEQAAAAIFTCDVAGVSIIGVSSGSSFATVAAGDTTDNQMPTFILDHASATVSVTAANVTLKGLKFESDAADCAIGITAAAGADGLVVDGCYFRDGAAAEELVIGVSIAAACTDVQVKNCYFSTYPGGGCANAILLAGASDDSIFENNVANGTYSGGAFLATAAASRNLTFKNNTFCNQGAIAVDLNAGTTGVMANNYLAGTTSIAAALTDVDAMWLFENYVSGEDNKSGLLDPAADAD
ncbi:MAG: right-handed parallel beta-helix repeat-containing protein, partial [Phycisphaerae bacterium]|nr:right-handed parallel beta-helix repeat-containing protein [Phycisphaerae bacterium]